MSKPWKILCGDALTMLKTLPDESVQCCVTSPPYYNLRDYSTAHWEGGSPECDHKNHASAPKGTTDSHSFDQPSRQGMLKPYKDKCGRCGAKRVDQQIGLERTPEKYIEHLVGTFREIRRVLHPTGITWLNIGDSFAATHHGILGEGKRSQTFNFDKKWLLQQGKGVRRTKSIPVGLKSKDLIGIPWRVAFALQSDGWYLRCDIIWQKGNCMPDSVTDRPTRSHEYVFLLTKSPKYFYDSYAVSEEATHAGQTISLGPKSCSRGLATGAGRPPSGNGLRDSLVVAPRRNKRSVWEINTRPFREAHFATMPVELALTCIKAGTSEKGCCPKCGAPWKRIIHKQRTVDGQPTENLGAWRSTSTSKPNGAQGIGHYRVSTSVTESGWQPTCTCNAGDPVPCTVLDPFAGAATTGVAALQYGQHFLGIELNPAYIEIAEQRLQDEQKRLKGGPPASKQRQPIVNAPAKPWYEK